LKLNGLWEKIKTELFSQLGQIYQMLRLNHVSYQKMYILFIMMNNFPWKEDARNSVSQYWMQRQNKSW